MHITQEAKFVQAIKPASVSGGAFTGEVIDTLGFSELAIIVQLGALASALTVLKITECDTSGGSYTDVDGADFSVDGTLPSDTDDGKVEGIFINLQTRKRFIKVAATAGAGADLVSALGVLARAEVVPSDAVSRGLAQELIVIS